MPKFVDTSVMVANAMESSQLDYFICLFIYLGFYVAFNTVQLEGQRRPVHRVS